MLGHLGYALPGLNAPLMPAPVYPGFFGAFLARRPGKMTG